MANDQEKLFTAIDVLRAFEGSFPKDSPNETFDEAAIKSKETLCYLQRTKALFKAFDLPLDPKAFRSGKFIEAEDPRYQPVLAAWDSEMPPARRRHSSPDNLQHVFERFYDYWSRARSSSNAFDWILACSGYFAYLLETVAYPTIDSVHKALEPMEAVLSKLIAPDGRTVTKRQLVDDYGYPEEDPPDIFDEVIEQWEAEAAEYDNENPEGGPTA
jgi:hypothetical protein